VVGPLGQYLDHSLEDAVLVLFAFLDRSCEIPRCLASIMLLHHLHVSLLFALVEVVDAGNSLVFPFF